MASVFIGLGAVVWLSGVLFWAAMLAVTHDGQGREETPVWRQIRVWGAFGPYLAATVCVFWPLCLVVFGLPERRPSQRVRNYAGWLHDWEHARRRFGGALDVDIERRYAERADFLWSSMTEAERAAWQRDWGKHGSP